MLQVSNFICVKNLRKQFSAAFRDKDSTFYVTYSSGWQKGRKLVKLKTAVSMIWSFFGKESYDLLSVLTKREVLGRPAMSQVRF